MKNLLSKLPPQAPELEEAVLGALLAEKNAINKVIDLLTKESFYKPSHQTIYNALIQLHNKKESIDLFTLKSELEKVGKLEEIGGLDKLFDLNNKVTSSAHIDTHARIIHEKFLKREIIRNSSEMLSMAYDESSDAFDLLEFQQTENFNLQKHSLGKSFLMASDLLAGRIKEYETPSVDGLTGISTGIAELDSLTGGLQKGTFNIVAARPGMGKTAFMLNITTNCALVENKAVGVFSLEMNHSELMDRIVSAEALISSQAIKRKELTTTDFIKASNLINKPLHNIIIDDTAGLTLPQLRAKALNMKQKHNIELLAIDYLGLMRSGNKHDQNRTQLIGEISRGLKGLAKELDIPLLVLSQLNRGVEDRAGGVPRLSDLRDSGDIEQDADIVFFLYRPEYYGISVDESGNPTDDLCQLMVEKHRAGKLKVINTKVDFDKMRFSDYEL